MTTTREIHLVRRPIGIPVAADFSVVEAVVGPTGVNEVRVQTLIMSVDPYMRPRLNADQALNTPLLGGGIGRIIESRNAKFSKGQLVKHVVGFREVFVSDGHGHHRFAHSLSEHNRNVAAFRKTIALRR